MTKITNEKLKDMGMNCRKAKCGFCGKTIYKGEGTLRIGSISKQKFFVHQLGCPK